ncbi:hypothetical protein D9M69_637690 [compost metagenome]
MPGDGGGVAIEVEHLSDARCQLWREVPGRWTEFQLQGAGQWPQAEPAAATVQAETAAIAVCRQLFDAGQAPQGKMLLELLPAPGLEIIKAHGLGRLARIRKRERFWSWCDDILLAPPRLCKTDFQIPLLRFDLTSQAS